MQSRWNDEYLCDIVSPPLTTIGVPSREMGRMAAEMLLRRLQSLDGNGPEFVKLSQDLIIRSSTAAPLAK